MSTLSFRLLDDRPLMRAGIREVVSADRLFNPLAYAQSSGECLELIRRLQPDVALIDANITLPDAATLAGVESRSLQDARLPSDRRPEIAVLLGLSEATAMVHVRRIYRTIGDSNRTPIDHAVSAAG
jgi:DNA-binding NarL/FixJ family response regulator